jgi:hypothetical protein
MVLYHHGAAIQPCVTKHGKAFVARASILAEDGEATSSGISESSRVRKALSRLPCAVPLHSWMANPCRAHLLN